MWLWKSSRRSGPGRRTGFEPARSVGTESSPEMNPLWIARNLREQYLTLLTTAFAPRQEGLARSFRAEIEKDGFLTREPFIALAQPYQHAAPIDGLSAEA